MIGEFKKCTKCKQTKRLDSFPLDSHAKDGHSSWCKLCHRKHHKANLPEARAAKLMKNYSMTLADYGAMVERQEGKCAICGKSHDALVVDHDHATDRVRGLLCPSCNHLLGRAGDDIELLAKAIEYLRKKD